MTNTSNASRRSFIKKALGTAFVAATAPNIIQANDNNIIELPEPAPIKKSYAANDKVNIAVIGTGIMGFNNLATSVQIPGVLTDPPWLKITVL